VAVARQDLDYYDDEQTSPPEPWHNRTPAVIGASILGLAAIGLLILVLSFVARQFSEPEQAPLNFVEPTYSATATRSATTTTTQTITSTSPPVTTDLDPGLAPPPPPPTSSSETSSDDPTAEEDEDDEDDVTRTPRRGPRTNVTRTLYPAP
jgi:hypothetical protein